MLGYHCARGDFCGKINSMEFIEKRVCRMDMVLSAKGSYMMGEYPGYFSPQGKVSFLYFLIEPSDHGGRSK